MNRTEGGTPVRCQGCDQRPWQAIRVATESVLERSKQRQKIMSRIGKKPVAVPGGVKVAVADRVVTVGRPHGQARMGVPPGGRASTTTTRPSTRSSRAASDERLARALHGLTRAVLQNMMVGVTQGYEKRLEIVGVGYLAAVQGQTLQLRVGFANELQVPIPEGVKVTCPDQQHIVIQGIDKQLVGQFAAEVRRLAEARAVQGQGHPLPGRGGPPQAGQGHGEVRQCETESATARR